MTRLALQYRRAEATVVRKDGIDHGMRSRNIDPVHSWIPEVLGY